MEDKLVEQVIKQTVAYCPTCNRPRMIINGMCPGCLQKGEIVFDTKINVTKLMSKENKGGR